MFFWFESQFASGNLLLKWVILQKSLRNYSAVQPRLQGRFSSLSKSHIHCRRIHSFRQCFNIQIHFFICERTMLLMHCLNVIFTYLICSERLHLKATSFRLNLPVLKTVLLIIKAFFICWMLAEFNLLLFDLEYLPSYLTRVLNL